MASKILTEEELVAVVTKESSATLLKELKKKSDLSEDDLGKLDRAALIKAVVDLRKAATPSDTPPTSDLMMFMQFMRQEKLEAEQRLLVAEQRLKNERQEAKNRHAALLMAFKEDSKIRLDANKDALEASSREEHALQKKREAKEQEYGARLLKAKTLMKDLLTDMPEEPADIPAYFVNVSRAFTQNKIDDDLQVTILRPRLTRESIRLLDGSPPTDIKTFEQIRNLILRIYKLSPGKYKEFFKSAEKKTSETWTQFANRLSILWGYY